MRFRTIFIASQSKSLAPLLYDCQAFCSYSQIQSKPKRSSFGIAFDIDGVILRGRDPIGGSSQALRRLYKDSGALRVPFLLLTNGGGIPESRRAIELGELLGVNILPSQVVQGHTPFKNLLNRYENELIIATGKGIPALVMSEYGFKNVVSLEEYASYFKSIDPVSQYKNWTTDQALDRISHSNRLVSRHNVLFDRVKAAFVVSDPVDWGRDIQVLCDILRSGGLPGEVNGNQPSLYFAADDLEYQIQLKFRNHEALISAEAISFFDLPMIEEGDLNQAAFASERLGMGAFRIALESIFNKIHHKSLEYVCYGKPNSFVFKNAESILSQLQHITNTKSGTSQPFKTLYMIGDNPSVDIRGAQQAGHPWFSILTRTGVFKGKYNHTKFPADLVVDTVEEAIDYVLKRECAS